MIFGAKHSNQTDNGQHILKKCGSLKHTWAVNVLVNIYFIQYTMFFMIKTIILYTFNMVCSGDLGEVEQSGVFLHTLYKFMLGIA